LNAIAKKAHPKMHLSVPLAKRAMAKIFKRLRGDLSIDAIWNFATVEFQAELSNAAEFPDEIDTKSNLWPKLSKEINASVGLECPLLDVHSTEIGQLVGRRNKIAHGEKLEITDLTQFQKYEHAVLMVMHELAIAVVKCLDEGSYLSNS